MKLRILPAIVLLLAIRVFAADLDHDGIPDDWETNGVWVTLPDGHKRFLNLPEMLASPQPRHIIVWINWMEAPDHTHYPIADKSIRPGGSGEAAEKEALARIKDAFKKQGINLILIYGEHPIPETPQIGDLDSNGDYVWDDLDALTKKEFPVEPAGFDQAVHLCTFIHQMGGAATPYSGMAMSIPGREFLVSLGGSANQIGTANSQGGTFMHELGHDLGLHHGGSDDRLYKPNYLSVMNYLFQINGVQINKAFGNFDYSDHKFDFDERSVDGRLGVTADKSLSNYGSAEVCNTFLGKYRYFESVNAPVRWDCTDRAPAEAAVPKDVNKDGDTTVLAGWHDWKVVLAPVLPGAGVPQVSRPKPAQELQVSRIASILASLTIPTVSVTREANGISVRWQRIPLDSVVAYELLRTGPSGHTDVVRQTRKTEYVDSTGEPGRKYVYQVRAVLNGPAAEAIHEAAASIEGVASVLASEFKSVIPPRKSISELLMRGRASAPVSAPK